MQKTENLEKRREAKTIKTKVLITRLVIECIQAAFCFVLSDIYNENRNNRENKYKNPLFQAIQQKKF